MRTTPTSGYHAQVDVVVVVQVAQQVHPPGVMTIAVRPTEVAPILPANLSILTLSFLCFYHNSPAVMTEEKTRKFP